jgi:hypothetical protein
VFTLGQTVNPDGRTDVNGRNGQGLSIKLSSVVKLRTVDWVEPGRSGSPKPLARATSTLSFLSPSLDTPVQAMGSVALYNPTERLLGKVSMFGLTKRSVEQQQGLVPVTMALWQIPRETGEGVVETDQPVPPPPRIGGTR